MAGPGGDLEVDRGARGERAPDRAHLVDGPVDHQQQALPVLVAQPRQVQLQRLLEQWIALLLAVGGAGDPDDRPVVVAQPTGQRASLAIPLQAASAILSSSPG